MIMINYLFSLFALVFVSCCEISKNGDKISAFSLYDSLIITQEENLLQSSFINDTMVYFEQMNDEEKENFVSENIRSEMILDFWKTRKENKSSDYYFKVISNFDKSGKYFDFYFYCLDRINEKQLIDDSIFELIQKYYELVYDANRFDLFNYLRRKEAFGDEEKVNTILNSIGYSFQSIIQDDTEYFNKLIDKDPLNKEYYKRIEKSAIENM